MWIVDRYYEEEVRYIYDTVVEALLKNPARRFIFVEVAFFMRWWAEQDEATQNATRGLFASGQLEFVNGGWCMADDASPRLDDFVDQVRACVSAFLFMCVRLYVCACSA